MNSIVRNMSCFGAWLMRDADTCLPKGEAGSGRMVGTLPVSRGTLRQGVSVLEETIKLVQRAFRRVSRPPLALALPVSPAMNAGRADFLCWLQAQLHRAAAVSTSSIRISFPGAPHEWRREFIDFRLPCCFFSVRIRHAAWVPWLSYPAFEGRCGPPWPGCGVARSPMAGAPEYSGRLAAPINLIRN